MSIHQATRRYDIVVAFASTKSYIWKGVMATLLLIFFGCATAPPVPVTIKHQRTPSLRDAAMPNEQPRKESAAISSGAAQSAAMPNGQSRKEPPDMSIAALVELLKKKNVISAAEGDRIITQSENQAAIEKQSIQYQVKSEVQEELPNEIEKEKTEVASAIPEWTKRFRFSGDIRLRYQDNFYNSNNAAFAEPSNPSQLLNTTINQDFYYYRVRFGPEIAVNDQLKAVIVTSTGNTSTPISTNQIMGTYLNKGNVTFDLAYLQWQPAGDFLTVWGGRMPNPWFSSVLVWARDLNFEGLALTVKKPVTKTLTPFLTLGAFPLQTDAFSHNKWLYAGQLGLETQSRQGIAAKVGVAYYYYNNVTGIKNNPLDPGATDWTAPLYQQKGNTLFNISATPNTILTALAAEFKELNVTGTLDIGFWDPYHILLLGNYVNNLGFNLSDVIQNTGNQNQTKDVIGYQIGMSVGYPAIKDFGQWQVHFDYRSIDGDAVVDAFNDSDFHLGGTNAKGWTLQGDAGLLKNVWFTIRWMTAQEINGPPLTIDVLQMDLNARF
ncbi:MAG TPA: outer membrane receptor for ferric coprogen and ferric-rhodotorulic acid [Nitrospiraceae bacterium]|jgi:hypothetical protein|nr:outer membrane receptor for ferric coprogen and ferric-rhodotorulic acid [Nitrospiraceae bacterium]